MITDFDDYCIHQTTMPLAHPGPSDRNFYDRYWFNGLQNDGEYMFEVGFGIYPNRFVMDGHFSVSVGDHQHTFHASCRAPEDRTQTNIGPLSIKVLEPMRVIQVRLEANDSGFECDLRFHARSVATEEPKNLMVEGVHVIMDNSRFTQLGRWEGYFSVNGERTDVVLEGNVGTRDKSWGVRPIGEPQGGAPGLLNKEPGVYWCWSPIHFKDFGTQFGSFQDHDGNSTQLSACRTPLYDNPDDIPRGIDPGHEEMATMTHRVHWESGTRRSKSAEFNYVSAGGERYDIQLEPLRNFYMLALGYQHPEWTHGVWQGELKTGFESWCLSDIDPLDYKNIHIHQLVRARMGDEIGIGTLETIVFGRHPSGFKELLDGAE